MLVFYTVLSIFNSDDAQMEFARMLGKPHSQGAI